MIKIGVLSDTHGHLDPNIPKLFAGVNHILHGGDIGLPWLILELQEIAPVTAIRGNDPEKPEDKIKRKIIRENPDVVIFGHTHKRFCEMIGQTLYFNPGYAGKPKFGLPRSVAILTCDESGITADYLELP
jgi:predicted phosphodiesterase